MAATLGCTIPPLVITCPILHLALFPSSVMPHLSLFCSLVHHVLTFMFFLFFITSPGWVWLIFSCVRVSHSTCLGFSADWRHFLIPSIFIASRPVNTQHITLNTDTNCYNRGTQVSMASGGDASANQQHLTAHITLLPNCETFECVSGDVLLQLAHSPVRRRHIESLHTTLFAEQGLRASTTG